MNYRKGIFFLILVLAFIFPAASSEYSYGSIRLVLDEATGRFSLFYIPQIQAEANSTGAEASRAQHQEPLFSDKDTRTSFLSVIINDRIYKLGDSSAFRIRSDGERQNPSLIFESSFLSVTEEFLFISIPGSSQANGIRIKITIENKSDRQISAGARLLLDLYLGEQPPGIPVSTNYRTINSETLIDSKESDYYWIDKNGRYSLIGSLNTGSPGDPDSVHFANWKKLSDVTWKAPFQAGRNFNNPPYSVNDTSVCYYYEPRPLGRGEKISHEITFLGNDSSVLSDEVITSAFISGAPAGFRGAASMPAEEIRDLNQAGSDTKTADLEELRVLLAQIDTLINSGTASAEELSAIEFSLNKLRVKYGLSGGESRPVRSPAEPSGTAR